jgi:anti-sigma factor RsiW
MEVKELIEELSEAAESAIEQAAAESARAAMVAFLDREAAAIREARRWQGEYEAAKKAGIRTAVIAGAVCFLVGLAAGVGGVLIISN